MSKDTPEVGDVWKNIITGDKIHLSYADKDRVIAWVKVGNTMYPYSFDTEWFLDAYEYLGKSKANIDDLFKTENEE